MLKVDLVKVEDREAFPLLEQQSGPNTEVMGGVWRRISEIPGLSDPSTSIPRSLRSANFTNAEGKRIIEYL